MLSRDADGVTFPFAPPNANIQHFIDTEIPSYHLSNEPLPAWVRVLARQQAEAVGPVSMQVDASGPGLSCSASRSATQPARSVARRRSGASQRTADITPPRSSVRTVRKRGSPEAEENIDLRDQQRVLQAQLYSASKRIEEVATTAQVQDQKILQVCVERNKLQHDINRLQMQIAELKRCVGFLSYPNLQPGGILGNAMK